MRNNENGITFIKFIFMLLILLVVIAGIVFIVNRLWKDTSTKNIETDLLYIQAKCKIIYDKNKIDPNELLLGENITEYPENEKVNEIISGSNQWYKLSQEDLEAIGLETVKAEDGYMINYEENDVICAKGATIQGYEEIYYRLSDLQKAEEQKEIEEQQKQEEKEKAKQEQTEEPEITEQQGEQTEQPQEPQESQAVEPQETQPEEQPETMVITE